MTHIPEVEEVVEELNYLFPTLAQGIERVGDNGVPYVSDKTGLDFLREKLTAVYERGMVDGRQEERDEVAKEIAMAGENKITLLDNAENFTGTYWISLNSLYFHLTGRHLNADWENGVIEKNPTIEALIRKEAALTTEGE